MPKQPRMSRTEIPLTLTYESDLDFVRKLMLGVAERIFKEEGKAIESYENWVKSVLLEHLSLSGRPKVRFDVPAESWVTARLRYLVHSRRKSEIKSMLIEQILNEFNKEPERVKFPTGRSR